VDYSGSERERRDIALTNVLTISEKEKKGGGVRGYILKTFT
jgi:hypothetical protein